MMRLTADQQKKGLAIGLFVLVAGGILYYQLSDDTPAPRLAAPVPAAQAPVMQSPAAKKPSGASAAKNLGSTSAQLDPTLQMGPMLAAERVSYNGNGRNIFSANSVPVAIPKPVASARPKAMAAAPVISAPLGPPLPPPIDLKFFGTARASDGRLQAFLLHGQDVFLAKDGDMVQRRYQIITVAASSVVVEDKANSNRQTLPLIAR
jgi:hypothetical protein